jgi:hypothetical protein
LLERSDPLVLVGLQLTKAGFESPQPVAILLGLTDEVGNLLLKRVEALVEVDDRRLGRRGIVSKTGGVRRAALREDLPLDLLHLLLETIEALLRRRRRLALRVGSHRYECQCGAGRKSGNQTNLHDAFPTLRFGTQSAASRIARR